MIIDAQTLKVLQNVEAFGQANDAQETDRARRMLNLERNTAELIQILVLSSSRKRILEIGTSNGYSALWLGTALRAIPGAQRLVTIERDAAKVRRAFEHCKRRAQRNDHSARRFGHRDHHDSARSV